jgi:aminopeptidase
MDPRIDKLAEVLIHYSLKLKKGEILQIQGEAPTIPLIKAVYNEAVEVGAYPLVRVPIPDLEEYMLKRGSDDQLKFIPPMSMLEVKTIDAYLGIWGSENTRYLSGVNPQRQALARLTRHKVMSVFYKREAQGKLRWCGTLFPTLASAQDAGKSLTDWEDFVYGAERVTAGNPIKHWQAVSKEQDRLVRILNRVDQIHIKAPGTDLKLRAKGRRWVNCCGQNNFPDGEIFTSPIDDSAEGKIRFTFPAVYLGREVEDVTLEFKRGKVVRFSAARNEDFLRSMLDIDKGARFLGELAIGTNYSIRTFSKNTLFDEKIGGTCHLALGESFVEAGGKNKSALHWDMVCDLRHGGEIVADGKIIHRNGKFVI